MPSPAGASSSASRTPGCWATAARSRTACGCATPTSSSLARSGATVVHNSSSNLRLAAGVAPLRRLVAAGVGVALGLDDMGIADDDDMLAEVRVAHVLQRVHGEPQHPRLRAAEVFGLMWDGGAQRGRARRRSGGSSPVAAAMSSCSICAPCARPYAVDDVDVWELLVVARQGGPRRQRGRGGPRADARAACSSTSTATRSWRRSRSAAAVRGRAARTPRASAPWIGAARAPHRRALPGAGLARRR